MGVEAARACVWDLDTASAGTTVPAPLGSVTTSEAFLTTPDGALRPGSEFAMLHPSWRLDAIGKQMADDESDNPEPS
jgi:hypothetical protein